MRVAFVTMKTTHDGDSAGGRRIERVARRLADRGHDVTVLCSQWWDGYAESVTRDHVTYRAVTVSPSAPSFVARVPVLLAVHRPDVVHVRPDPPGVVRTAGIGRYLSRAPLVVEWFGDEAVGESDSAFESTVTLPDMVVTPSELVRTVVREAGATAETTTVVPESIDTSLVESVDPGESVDVVYAHPLDGTANVEDLLLGLAELRDREWSATVVGDGPKRAAYERQAGDLRIDDRIEFVGDVDRERRTAIYRGAHAFVQTATRSYFPVEFLWALACGCVGIVEYQAGSSAHELVENYERSFRVTDPPELADAIVDAGEFDRLTEDDAWNEFDHDAVVDQYLDTYRTLVDAYGLF